eukprot:scaffold1486_cov329-Prasinococcus_capsulatus_cf.AAC.21
MNTLSRVPSRSTSSGMRCAILISRLSSRHKAWNVRMAEYMPSPSSSSVAAAVSLPRFGKQCHHSSSSTIAL